MSIFDKLFGTKNVEERSRERSRIKERLDLLGQNKNIDVELLSELLSEDLEIREPALIRARGLAKIGDKRGQIALEETIRIKGNLPTCEFYEPRVGVFSGDEILNADKEIYRLARSNKLLEDPKKTQSYISKLFILGIAANVMNKVESISEEQFHDFQLLGTHIQCRSEQIAKSRQKEE